MSALYVHILNSLLIYPPLSLALESLDAVSTQKCSPKQNFCPPAPSGRTSHPDLLFDKSYYLPPLNVCGCNTFLHKGKYVAVALPNHDVGDVGEAVMCMGAGKGWILPEQYVPGHVLIVLMYLKSREHT